MIAFTSCVIQHDASFVTWYSASLEKYFEDYVGLDEVSGNNATPLRLPVSVDEDL